MTDELRNQPSALDETADAGTLDTLGAGAARPPSPAWPALGPKYEVLRELGRGGMGVVYEVRHRALEKRLALKVMTGRTTPERTARFQQEARAASDIDHPNIVRVLDLDRTAGGTPYLVMELLEGRDLAAELAARGPLPLADVVALVRGPAEALDRAHARGIVHRDLKPQNLFATTDGVVKVLDFGICHYDSGGMNLTMEGDVIGTPLYMAPEQLRGEVSSAASDVYALAAVLYELLTGARPHEGVSLAELLRGRRDGTLQPASARRPGLPPAVDAALTAGLAAAPGDRPKSAGALVQALAEGLPGEPATRESPRAPSSVESLVPTRTVRPGTTPRAPRRTRPFAVIASAGFALAALVVALVLSSDGPDRPPRAGSAPEPGARPGPATEAVPEPTPTWPADLRLLVVPLASTPEREIDGILWPLADRFVIEALETDERIWGRLARIDPARVETEVERRELGPTLDADDVAELAAALGATLVLDGTLTRQAGRLHVRATLQPLTGPGLALAASGLDLPEAARALADEVRRALFGDGPPPAPTKAQRDALLVGTDESVRALALLDGYTPRTERERILREIQEKDPEAVGAAWLSFLDNLGDRGRAAALAAIAGRARDPEVAAFLAEVTRDGDGSEACRELDVSTLGARYPLLLGPLAEAVCRHRRGEWEDALRLAREGLRSVLLRPVAAPVVRKLLYFSRTCDEQLPLRMETLRLAPEQPLEWAKTAFWHARCDRRDEARRVFRVARALVGPDPVSACTVAHLAASVYLVDLDVDGAREWLALIEERCDPAQGIFEAYFVMALANVLEGHARRAMEWTRAGIEAFRERDDVYTMFVGSLFYMRLARGDRDGAQALVDELGARFDTSADVGNRYMTSMLRLALEHARTPLGTEALAARLDAAGREVVAALGDLGRDERDAEECMLLSALGPAELAIRVVDRASPANKVLGGCRVRRAERLLSEGRAAEAAEEYRRALDEILWARFLYLDEIAPALLGRARALAQSGARDEARRLYATIVRNYGEGDEVLPELTAAEAALTR